MITTMGNFRCVIAVVLLLFIIETDAIINGNPVNEHQYPFLANIMVDNEKVNKEYPDLVKLFNYPMRCGGVILADEWILTAYHCIGGSDAKIGEIFVSVGAHDFTEELETGRPRQYVKVSKVVQIGTWNRTRIENDFTLLKLERKLKMSNEVQSAEIAAGYNFTAGSELTVAGWGSTFRNASYLGISKTPLQAKVTITDWDSCQKKWATYAFQLSKSTICAGNKGQEINTCKFDAGNPLFYEENGKAQVVAVDSFGGSAYDCLYGRELSGYGEVSSLKQNITEIMNNQ